MRLVQTTWRPDTCGCELVYEWDADLPIEQRIHTPFSSTKCEFHSHLGDTVDHYESVKEENVRKNIIVNKIIELNPELKPEEIKYEFKEDRSISVELPVSLQKDSEIVTEIGKIVDQNKFEIKNG